jgi:hypothetical protein
MKPDTIDRRTFLSDATRTGLCVCGLCFCSPLVSFSGEEGADGTKMDLSKRNFCGYKCPEECTFLKATLEEDLELKKEAWKEWKIEERFDLAFDPEQAFCYGCKKMDKPKGVVLARCTVRDCAIEKGKECCIDCDELVECDKDLWRRFPDFKKQVVAAQVKYRQQS